jgi:aminotransferase
MCIRTLVGSGDDVLVVEPSFVCYKPIVETVRARLSSAVTYAENRFKLTAEELENAITPNTKLLVLPYPITRRAVLCAKTSLKKLQRSALSINLSCFRMRFTVSLLTVMRSIAQLLLLRYDERTIVINGFFKNLFNDGRRLGYALGPAPIIKQMTKLISVRYYEVLPPTRSMQLLTLFKTVNRDIKKSAMNKIMRKKYAVTDLMKSDLPPLSPRARFICSRALKQRD